MKDMTQGNPVKEVLLFSVPMILASVFQQMYNAVDSIIEDSLSAPTRWLP